MFVRNLEEVELDEPLEEIGLKELFDKHGKVISKDGKSENLKVDFTFWVTSTQKNNFGVVSLNLKCVVISLKPIT
jgi:hypothetical protein